MNKTQKWLTAAVLFCAGFLTFGMVSEPQLCLEAARDSVELCLDVVIPSLFPFFICSGLFVALGGAYYAGRLLSPVMRPLFRVPGSGALAFVLGILSGYPVGAKCAVDLYRNGSCTKTEAERLLAFCNNSGPLFILGAVGVGMLHSPQAGRLLYLSHFLSALFTGVLFRFYGKEKRGLRELPPSGAPQIKGIGAALGDVITSSVETMLKVCAFVVVFSVFAAILPKTPVHNWVYGFLEITGGIRNWIDTTGASTTAELACVSLFLACSGLSVLLQVSSIVSPSGLSVKPYVLGKALQGVLSFGITMLLLRWFPLELSAFAPAYQPAVSVPSPWQMFLLALFLIVWCLIAILVLCAVVWIYERVAGRKQ